MKNFTQLSDDQLFHMAKRYGKNALLWRRKFIGLLPEIYKRRLYEKKNYESIFVFAKKLAGLSEKQVRMVLNLEKRFEETPKLKTLLVNGEVSVNKLARVVSIATPENQEELSEKVKILSQSAVETLVRDEKLVRKEISKSKIQNGLHKPKIGVKSLRAQTLNKQLNLSEEVTEKLAELQEKGIDVNKMLLKMLEKRDQEIQEEKEEIARESKPAKSRYISKKVKNIIQKEHGTKCSIRACCKKAEVLHHSQPFALSKTHDPRFLAPLCKEHHTIAHSINLKMQKKRQKAIMRN